jgi:phosphohistidine phosphatase SixA
MVFIISLASCKKENGTTTSSFPTTFKVTSTEYIDSLLFVNKNDYQIQTTDPGATFSSSDPHIILTGTKGKIGRLTSAEVVPIVITWSKPGIPKTTIYALGATDNNQDMPFVNYQGQIATDCYGSYLQGWKTLQKLPVSGETYAIVLRHADASYGADWTVAHTTTGPADWWKSPDSTLARQLNPQGVDRATQLGQIFKDLNYPVTRIVTSEFYRARQTASLMNLGPVPTIDSRINHPSYNQYQPGLYLGMVAVLAAQPIDNNMTLIIAHHPINELNVVTGYPSFPNVSPFNWTGAYLIKVSTDGTITYEGAASWGMFKCWRDLKLHK